MRKNVAGQTAVVFAYNSTTLAPVTTDAANITATIAKQTTGSAFGAATSTNDANPTHLGSGYYAFDLTQAETNADHIVIAPTSATSTTIVNGVSLYPRSENNVYIAPSVTVTTGNAAYRNTVTLYQGAQKPDIVFAVVDEDGDAIDVSASTLRFVVWTLGDPETELWDRESGSGHITVASTNQVTVTYTSTNTATAGSFVWALWDVGAKQVLDSGPLVIREAAFDAA